MAGHLSHWLITADALFMPRALLSEHVALAVSRGHMLQYRCAGP
jgi:hypothetical protein